MRDPLTILLLVAAAIAYFALKPGAKAATWSTPSGGSSSSGAGLVASAAKDAYTLSNGTGNTSAANVGSSGGAESWGVTPSGHTKYEP
jgi:hypothetical protein